MSSKLEVTPDNKRESRRLDAYMDRRSGEDRRKVYSLEYFQKGGIDRRKTAERRVNIERRRDCVRVTEWSSVCPDYEEREKQE